MRWLGEQVSGVEEQLDEEQRRREHLMRTMTEELVRVWAQMQSMREELTMAKEYTAIMAKKATPEAEAEPVVEDASDTGIESAQEIKTLREELAAQEVLREKEREQRKLAEEERRRIEETL